MAKFQAAEVLLGARPDAIRMRSAYSDHPLHCRRHSSDAKVFYDVFAMREYAVLDDAREVDLIIDCGANVGYSSAYFLSRFPGANVIAVEPDPKNFEMLSRNLAAWGPRTKLIQAGVWSHPCGLVFSQDNYRDGREWAIQVREARQGEEAQVTAIDIGTLLRESGRERISILKVDIEQAEKVVFAENFDSWIGRVQNIAIELHDPECERVFFRAIEGLGFDVCRSGELTVCRKRVAAGREISAEC